MPISIDYTFLYLYIYVYKNNNIMGQMKKLLDTIFDIEETIYPQDMEIDYEIWLAQKEAEQLAYEELLADSK